MFLRSLLALTLAIAPLAAAPLAGQQIVQVNTDARGVAIYGYDPVAYFTDAKPLLGSATFTANYDGATWHFASAAHRDLFVKEPARYAPQYGGYCAFGVAGNYKVKIDPEAWRVEDGKLYLNYDKGVQRRWLADIPGYLAKSERNWPGLRDAARRDR
jgi:YHS domain-containing protein